MQGPNLSPSLDGIEARSEKHEAEVGSWHARMVSATVLPVTIHSATVMVAAHHR